jgi:hypothetical protein
MLMVAELVDRMEASLVAQMAVLKVPSVVDPMAA